MRRGVVAATLLLAMVGQADARVRSAARAVIPTRTPALGPTASRFVQVPAGRVAIRGVRLIDGTGGPAFADRTILLDGDRIAAVGGPELTVPAGATVLDRSGYTVMPGLVGMHDHLFYMAAPQAADGTREPLRLVPQMSFSAPRLYLAMGVTTLRTGGSVEPYADLNLKRLIDGGDLPGPRLDVTGPYLEGRAGAFVQMHGVSGAADARAFVRYWAGQGVTSLKLYTNLSRAEAAAGIAEAHAHGLRVTGHLCSITYAEAAGLGIDNLEHGFFVDTALDPDKRPDLCPASGGGPTLAARLREPRLADPLIALLVRRGVAVTSTLPVFEQLTAGRARPSAAALAMLSAPARVALLATLDRRDKAGDATAGLQRLRGAMALERRFVAAGGVLLAGPDPTGNGGVLPGFGDLRGITLLVEAGFPIEQAVRIATLNGATYLGLADRIGTVTRGKLADLVMVRGDPTTQIGDLEQVETVWKDGVGYASAALRASVAGRYGQY